MKVRFLGLGLSAGGGISLNDFMDQVSEQNGTSFDFNKFKRFCYINEHKDQKYFVGLFLTIKDQKKFCELKDEDGSLKVKVNTLDSNSNLMDFNFFIVNKKNGLCLYQHYHNSCSANQFGYFLHHKFKEQQEKLCLDQKSTNSSLTEKQKKTINKKYKKGLTWELMVRPEKIGALLDELDSIRSFEIDFFSLKANESEFVPLTNFVSKERRKFNFLKEKQTSGLPPIITNIISKLNVTKGRVFGKDLNGIERIIRISDNPDNFGEYEYDGVAEKLNSLDIENFHDNWIVKELLKKAKEFNHIFEASIQNEN